MRTRPIEDAPGVPFAFREGVADFLNNLDVERDPKRGDRRKCPYDDGTQESREWADGFFGIAGKLITRERLNIPFDTEAVADEIAAL